jgi:glycosyltransferase involved in cell wall biosynthesis
MTDDLVSVVLPVHNQADHIRQLVGEYVEALDRARLPYELILVPNGSRDATERICGELAAALPAVRSASLERGGWGRAVRHGLAAARGAILCYTNSARTAPEDLSLAILYARMHPGTVVKANRKIREHWTRRLGSLLYNLECRALFDLSCWDVNGTPKVFPRSFGRLLALTRDDDLIDLEFVAICRREGYRMLEIPVFSTRRHGGRSTTTLRSAFRLYVGAWALARERR